VSTVARLFAVLRLLSFVAATAFAVAQDDAPDIRYPNAEKFERSTKTDDKGLVQWADHEEQKCKSCAGTGQTRCTTCIRFDADAANCPECKLTQERKVPCRACGGLGHWADPLQKVHCPGCMAAGFLLCTICGGGGRLKVNSAKQWSDCPGCRGTGSYKCGACNGQRLVETAALKPSLKDAPSAALQKAIAAADESLKQLAAVNLKGGDTARKEVKALIKAMEPAAAYFPPLKRLPKSFEDYMGKIYAGNNFQGHEENEAQTMGSVKLSTEYYLKHQKRMMELCQKRAEANAKVEAESKGK
jgi:nitrate reductase cytochrome c-type subunit